MDTPHVARASASIRAPAARVWEALVTPEIVKRYMFGTTVLSSFEEGGSITWKGEWQGKAYEDKGTILRVEPQTLLRYTHYSPLSGLPDAPESYHTVTVALSQRAGQTHVTLTQDNNPTEQAREHSERNWKAMLDGLKKVLEA